jgi:hypothetical protein
MKSEKDLKEIAKRDANRFCRRNKVYETYDGSVADMIKKLYITTYLRARHQIMSEVNQPESAKNSSDIPFPKLVKKPLPAVSTPSNVGYKSWSELTPMDKAVFRFTGGKLINCYWDYKRSPDSTMTPVVREVKDQKERNANDKITYVVGPKQINIWYLAKGEDHSEIKEMNPLTDDVKELCKRINL